MGRSIASSMERIIKLGTMKWIIISICLVYIILSQRAKHVYKSKLVPHTSETGFLLGSIFGAIIDALAYYWLFKCIEII